MEELIAILPDEKILRGEKADYVFRGGNEEENRDNIGFYEQLESTFM